MKRSLLVLLAGILLVFGCTKTNVLSPASDNALSPAASSEKASAAAVQTPPALLTAHAWKYNAFYLHYIDAAHKGVAQYIRGSQGNIIDLNTTRFTFQTNGTFLETENGYNYPGTWQFSNAADTVLVMNYSYGTNKNTILTLSKTQLNYKKAIGSYSHGNFSYTELIDANAN